MSKQPMFNEKIQHIINIIAKSNIISETALLDIKSKTTNPHLHTLIDNKIAQIKIQKHSNLSELEEKHGQKEKNTFDHILSIVNDLSIPDIQNIINNNKLYQYQLTHLKNVIKQKQIKEAQMLTNAIKAIKNQEQLPQEASNRQLAEKIEEQEQKAREQEQKAREQYRKNANKKLMNTNKQIKKNLNNGIPQQIQEDRLDKFGMIASIVSIIFFIVTFIPAFFRKDLGYTDSDINTIAPILISIYVVFLIILFAIYKYG